MLCLCVFSVCVNACMCALGLCKCVFDLCVCSCVSARVCESLIVMETVERWWVARGVWCVCAHVCVCVCVMVVVLVVLVAAARWSDDKCVIHAWEEGGCVPVCACVMRVMSVRFKSGRACEHV